MRTPLALATTLALLTPSPAHADIVVVNVFDYDFSTGGPEIPVADAVIHAGDTVRWVFINSHHSSTSVAGIPEQWNSDFISIEGQTFDHTFTHVGVWHYYCFPHGLDNGDGTASGMSGTITVLPAPCAADFNGDTLLTSADITAFLTAWFADLTAGTTIADFNGSGATTSADITAFLTAWFDGLDGC